MADTQNKPPQHQMPDESPSVASQRQPRPCPQDCSQCSESQHIFCSAKMLFDLSRAVNDQRRQQAELAQAVAEIREQLKPKGQDVQLSIPFNGVEEAGSSRPPRVEE